MSRLLPGLDTEPATVVEAGDLLIVALPDDQSVETARAIQGVLDEHLPAGVQVMFLPGATITVVKKGSTA